MVKFRRFSRQLFFCLCLVTSVNTASAPTSPCPLGCTKCEILPGTMYVIRAVCSGVQPSRLPTSVRELRVTQVKFPGVLTPDSFENKTDLTLLEMTNSTGCAVIWDNAFGVCAKLKNLMIENTDLLHVGENSFQGLVTLETLSLKQNNIMDIKNAFVHLKTLIHLDLSLNKLSGITNDTFPGLTKLFELNLAGNQIVQIDSEAFQDLQSLDLLDLENNRIQVIETGLFQGLSNLKRLDMKNNKISLIKESAFNGTNIQTLDLQSNSFTDFPSDAFNYLSHTPMRLSFSQNSITKLTDFMFKNISCQILDLTNNKINSIASKTFEDCNILTVLLNFNNISTMPAEIQPFWEKARAITIGGNQWKCDCDLLWMVKFISHSSPRKYKARATSPMPSCAVGTKYANQPFNKVENPLHADCVTTTMKTTSETQPSTSQSQTTTESTTLLTTTARKTTTTDSTTLSSTIPTTQATTILSTVSEKPSTVKSTTTESPVSPKVAVKKESELYPGLWIGLGVLAALLLAGFLFWFCYFKNRDPKNSKVSPPPPPHEKDNIIPPMLTPTMIQVQAPVSTAMPEFPHKKKKLGDLDPDEKAMLKLHNSRTLKTTSIA